MPDRPSDPPTRLAEILAALSLVTDLARGRPPEEAIRACLVATALAESLGLSDADRSDVYYTTLLRYVGCTATSHEYAAVFGDDVATRATADLLDMTNPADAVRFFGGLRRGAPPLERLAGLGASLARGKGASSEGARADCEVAAAMARRFDLDPGVRTALLQIFERWDGKGSPRKLRGDRIALPSRVAAVAFAATMFQGPELDPSAAADAVRRWSGRALDPAVCEAFLGDPDAALERTRASDAWRAVVDAEPPPRRTVSDRRLDDVALGFADAVDLKSPWFHGHSARVAELASAAAAHRAWPEETVTSLRRAALLHDLGRAAVPTNVWEKPGPLSMSDWELVRLHPYHTERILSRAPALRPLARLAGLHHERVDGSGYHRGAPASMLDDPARTLAAADAFEALTADRPHRPARSTADAARMLESMPGMDQDAVGAVLAAAGERTSVRVTRPAGLTDREVQVLRLLASGRAEKQIARELFVSPSTVHTHIAHIYEKAGVSTRAGAAMFAMEHDLIRPEAGGENV